MSTDSQLAAAPVTPGFQRATSALSEFLGIEPRMMVETLKKQCFPGMHPDQISDAQLAAFISVANSMGLNPLIPGMLYAYPAKNGGIVPVSGPDGVLKKLDEKVEQGKLEPFECTVYPEDVTQKPTHAVAKIWRKGSERPAVYTAVYAEWAINANPNWASRPRHMLWLRAIKQCARQVIHGVPYDEDDVKIGDMMNVTPPVVTEPVTPPAPERPAAPTRSKKGAAAVVENPSPAESKPDSKARGNVVEGNIVEGEFTQQPPANAPDTPAPASQPDPVATLRAKQEAAIKAKAAEAAAKEAAGKETKESPPPKAALADGETITVTAEITDIATMMSKFRGAEVPLVQAQLKNGYSGIVRHYGGGKVTDADKKTVAADPLYQLGAVRKFTLKGALNKVNNTVVALVEKIEAVEAPGETDME